MVTQEMLEAAMVEAVKRGMFPKAAPADQYITAWEDMRAVLEAAQQGRAADSLKAEALRNADELENIANQLDGNR